MLRIFATVCLVSTAVLISSAQGDEIKKRVEEPVGEAIAIMQKTQQDEEQWRLLQEKLTAEFDSLQLQVDQLTDIKNKLEEDVARAKERVEKKSRQLRDIKRIEQEMEPFLEDLAARLAVLPDQQLPFLQQERIKRISRLDGILADPEISLSEKYRKSMEVLQIEAEFGLTIESAQETIELEGQEILANVFRLGRVGLYYVTLDERQCGVFDLAESGWKRLPDRYVEPLKTAVAIAEKRRPVEFISMPLGRMVKK